MSWDTEKRKAYMRKYFLAHKEHLYVLNKGYNRAHISRLTDAIHSAFGNKCKNCGFSDRRALQIDHINGGGHKERVSKGTKTMLRDTVKLLRENPAQFFSQYQLLCANCNWIKRYTHDLPEGKSGLNR